jgi:hypothetical protein
MNHTGNFQGVKVMEGNKTLRLAAKAREKLMGQLKQIIAAFPDEVRLDQYPYGGTRIPESAMEINILLRQCQFKFERQGILDTITVGMIHRRILDIEKELYGTHPGSSGLGEPAHAYTNHYNRLYGMGIIFPFDDWKRFYSEIVSLASPTRNN